MEAISSGSQVTQYAVAVAAVRQILITLGEDPTRDGLLKTPQRVIKALTEMTEGYAQDPEVILSATFDDNCDQMVVLDGIEFVSLCEHHMLPFTGTARVAYIPNKRIVGISKLARVVECFAKRLQVQERMTNQIADAVESVLNPLGVGVVVRAHHQCMSCRGVKQAPSVAMITSALRGAFKSDPTVRNEFLGLK